MTSLARVPVTVLSHTYPYRSTVGYVVKDAVGGILVVRGISTHAPEGVGDGDIGQT